MKTQCIEGIWWMFEDRWPFLIYTGHSVLLPAKFGRCVLSDMKIKGTSSSPTLSFELTSIRTALSSSISPYLCLPPLVCSVHFSIETFWWRIADKAMLRGINEMLGIGWLPHHPSHALDVVLTAVFDRVLVIVIPSQIHESVCFPLLESLSISHTSHDLLDAITILEAWDTRSCIFFLQHIVIVHLHTLLHDPTLDIFVLFTRHKWVVGVVLQVCSTTTLRVTFPWLSNVIAQRSPSAGVCFRPLQRRWRWLRL